jgi:hypothetical protein
MAVQSLQRKRKPKPLDQRTCAQCGRLFMAQRDRRRPNTYCSLRCGRHADRKLAPCPRCGSMFWPWANGKHERKHCSRRCADANTAARRRLLNPPKEKPQRPLRACRWCRTPFRSPHKSYCSKDCLRQATNQRKHLRRRGMRRNQELIPLLEIYRRDRGICALCRRRVSLKFKPNHAKSATLDHIVPVHPSTGGKHTRENVQLAHFGCNSAKRERACGSQLRLI